VAIATRIIHAQLARHHVMRIALSSLVLVDRGLLTHGCRQPRRYYTAK